MANTRLTWTLPVPSLLQWIKTEAHPGVYGTDLMLLQCNHVNEEVGEVIECIATHDDPAHLGQEIADIYLSAITLIELWCDATGQDFSSCLNASVTNNLKRKRYNTNEKSTLDLMDGFVKKEN